MKILFKYSICIIQIISFLLMQISTILMSTIVFAETNNNNNFVLQSVDAINFPLVVSAIASDTSFNINQIAIKEDGVLQIDSVEVIPPGNGQDSRLADIIFVIDDSGSMRPKQQEIVNNIKKFLDNLVVEQIDFRLGLVRYGHGGWFSSPKIEIQLFNGAMQTTDVELFKNKLNTFTASGLIEPAYDSLGKALEEYSFRPCTQKTMILLTDEPSNGDISYDLESIINFLQEKNVTVFPMVAETKENGAFAQIATATNGKRFDILDDLEDILDSIRNILGGLYIVKYKSNNLDLFDHTREVSFTVASNTVTGSYTIGGIPNIELLEDESLPIYLKNGIVKVINAVNTNEQLNFKIKVTDEVAPLVQEVKFYYRKVKEIEFQELEMTGVGDNKYEISFNVTESLEPGFEFYFSASDGKSTSTYPQIDPEQNAKAIAIKPNQAPRIEHNPPENISADENFVVRAKITDDKSIKKAELSYRKTGTLSYQKIEMIGTESIYSAVIPKEFVTGNGIDYFIMAEDNEGVKSYHGDSTYIIAVAVEGNTPLIRGESSDTIPPNPITDLKFDRCGKSKWYLDFKVPYDNKGVVKYLIWYGNTEADVRNKGTQKYFHLYHSSERAINGFQTLWINRDNQANPTNLRQETRVSSYEDFNFLGITAEDAAGNRAEMSNIVDTRDTKSCRENYVILKAEGIYKNKNSQETLNEIKWNFEFLINRGTKNYDYHAQVFDVRLVDENDEIVFQLWKKIRSTEKINKGYFMAKIEENEEISRQRRLQVWNERGKKIIESELVEYGENYKTRIFRTSIPNVCIRPNPRVGQVGCQSPAPKKQEKISYLQSQNFEDRYFAQIKEREKKRENILEKEKEKTPKLKKITAVGTELTVIGPAVKGEYIDSMKTDRWYPVRFRDGKEEAIKGYVIATSVHAEWIKFEWVKPEAKCDVYGQRLSGERLKKIVIHATASDSETAYNSALGGFRRGGKNKDDFYCLGAHFYVGKNGDVVQTRPIQQLLHHAGVGFSAKYQPNLKGYNFDSIGIEMVNIGTKIEKEDRRELIIAQEIFPKIWKVWENGWKWGNFGENEEGRKVLVESKLYPIKRWELYRNKQYEILDKLFKYLEESTGVPYEIFRYDMFADKEEDKGKYMDYAHAYFPNETGARGEAPKKLIDYYKALDKFSGIITHHNATGKWDTGPVFNVFNKFLNFKNLKR